MASKEELVAEAEALFLKINLDAANAKATASGNAKFRAGLVELIHAAGVADGCDKVVGNMLLYTQSKFPANATAHRGTVLSYITGGKLRTTQQLEGCFKYLKAVGAEPIDAAKFEEESGVGVEIGAADISAAVAGVIEANAAALKADRYHFNTNILLGKLKAGAMKWADGAAMRAEMAKQVEALLGPKTEADLAPRAKKEKPKKEKKPKAAAAAAVAEEDTQAWRNTDPYAFFPKPQENNVVHTKVTFSDDRPDMNIGNSAAELAAHLERTSGKVVTRFPPEPNGYLHIGHAKAMFVDFGMAVQYGGVCYLRFDDTNPEAEKQEYIDHIQDIVQWLGWKPAKITYSSDYFQMLYDFALKMIEDGNAYVCHQTAEEIKESREKRTPSPWRDRPIEETRKWFEDMRRGLVDEGKATLRMKMDVANENVNMGDLIAYRIKFVEHPKAGDKWCIYPSYDYTHCIVDALEDITHSLCTLEFESRRASYYWLLEMLGTYKPLVWEYSRLNITNNVMSKRKLNRLVMEKFVDGWDDPRLLTLAGLRRRGVPPTAINNFCRDIGITRTENEVHLHRLDYHIRMELEQQAPRSLAVLRPLKLVLVNLENNHMEEVECKRFPQDKESTETYKVPLTKIVYIEETDFREQDEKGYYGAAPDKTIMLKYGYPVKITGFKKAGCKITQLQGEVDRNFKGKPPKGVLNWVGCPQPNGVPLTMECRLYGELFKSPNPSELDDWLGDLNPESLEIIKGAAANPVLAKAKVGDTFQLERLGYFAVDPESKPGKLIMNRTVTLKESKLVKDIKSKGQK